MIKHALVFLYLFSFHVLGISQVDEEATAKSFLISEIGFPIDLRMVDHSVHPENGHHYYYFHQQVNGIDIYQKISSAIVSAENKVLHHTTRFVKNATTKNAAPQISVEKALQSASKYLGYSDVVTKPLSKKTATNDKHWHQINRISSEKVSTQLIYYPIKNQLKLCWEVSIYEDQKDIWWDLFLDAKDGSMVHVSDWTLTCNWGHTDCNHTHEHKNCTKNYIEPTKKAASILGSNTYHVFEQPVESPLYGDRSIVSDPWNNALNASPFGWHDTDGNAGEEFTITRGNNVFAYEDIADSNAPGYSPDGGTALCFDFPMELDSQQPIYYIDAAITNLFYWNNAIHDILYQYDFTEVAGNFQENNYGNGGLGEDYVKAECQDGSGSNNANFSTPPDGQTPRMQMYNWQIEAIDPVIEITSPSSIEGTMEAKAAYFGTAIGLFAGDIELADPLDACTTLNNTNLDGKIAMIDRGSCPFVLKAQHAEEAGALAVIICNNNTDPIFIMSGMDSTLTIPTVMMSMEDCDTIKANLPVDLSIELFGPFLRDSDVDNGVIIHEYGHGVSNRLTGGPSTTSCLFNQEQMGEGWSDYLALMLTLDADDLGEEGRGIGNYLVNDTIGGDGIRPYPYSTVTSINPHTYDDIKVESVPHGVGSVWCVMLWDMTWKLIDKYGFDSDIYNGTGGNNKALSLVIEAMKLQPCSPGFIDGRDAILAADEILYGGENVCLIWEAFADRGLGFSADQGSPGSRADGSESFDYPISCLDTFAIIKKAQAAIKLSDTIDYSLQIFNNLGFTVDDIELSDQLSSKLDYVLSSLTWGMESANTISLSLDSLASGMDTTCYFKASPNVDLSDVYYYDDIEGSSADWSAIIGQGTDGFNLNTDNPRSGLQSWFILNAPADNTHYLESPLLSIASQQAFSFWHAYDTEFGWDGGYLEISTDGMTSWNILEEELVFNPYNGSLGASSNDDIANKPGFTGDSGGYINTMVDLSNYDGQDIHLRFVYGSDNNTVDHGWYLDDFAILSIDSVQNIACLSASNAADYCDTVVTYLLADCDLIYTLYEDLDNDGFGTSNDSIYHCDVNLFGYAANKLDCDDNESTVYPNATELCDGLDNNCNGIIDEDCPGNYVCDDVILLVNVASEAINAASEKLIADGVQTLDNLLFVAGDTISLEPGFEFPMGLNLDIIIEACNESNDLESENDAQGNH